LRYVSSVNLQAPGTRYLRLAELKLNVTLIRYDKSIRNGLGDILERCFHLFSGFKIKRVTGEFQSILIPYGFPV